MGDREVAHLQLELEREVEPITGRVRVDGADERRFAGMLELMRLLDEARTVQPTREEPSR